MVKRAFVESRPYLLFSLIFGISYFFIRDGWIPGFYAMLWKSAAVGFLVLYALRRHPSFDAKLLAGVMAFGSLGDMLIEIDLTWGAIAFVGGHLAAIWLYVRNRRENLAFSQKAFAILLIPFIVFIAWILPADRSAALGIAVYALFLAAMAAMAWTSVFPRTRVGAGALMFVLSDLLIFAEIGPLASSNIPWLLIWPLYYFGQFLICTGVIQTLRKDIPCV